MTTICHLFDETAGWEQRIGASQLIDHSPNGQLSHVTASIDALGAVVARALNGHAEQFHRLGGFTPSVAPSVQRFLRRKTVDCVHAWGLQAALVARAATDLPLVVHVFDAELSDRDVKLLRTLVHSGRFAVACATDTVRRRLVEGGLPPHVCVLIRPAVDFALVRQCQKDGLRSRLGLTRDEFVVVVPKPMGICDRALEIFWAVVIVNASGEAMRLIVPGRSRGQRRIGRLDRTGLAFRCVTTPPPDLSFVQLVAISDALVICPDDYVSTTSIAWAMASGSVVIAPAVYAVAELIADKVNGLLFNPKSVDRLSTTIARLLLEKHTHAKVKEVARGHAYEVFSMRRYVDQHERLRLNLLSGTGPGEGIVDAATVA